MLIARPDQEQAIADIREAFYRGIKHVLFVGPCGMGKTVLFCDLTKRVSQKNKRIMIIAHREELIDQISNTLNQFDLKHGIISPNYYQENRHPAQVASVFSLARRLHNTPPPDLLVIDEAHHAIPNTTWGKVLNHYKQSWVLGVTATPKRLSGEGLHDTFDQMILGPDTRTLIDMGVLSDYRLFVPPGIDTTGLHIHMGDYVKSEVSERVNKRTITGDAINHYKKLADGLPALVFCVSIEATKATSAHFKEAGYRAYSIDGKMDRTTRREVVKEFRNGQIQLLVSCQLIDEGFDVPGVHCIINLNPTNSLARYIQKIGRGLRGFPGKKETIILDHAGDSLRHGLPDEERHWSLLGATKRSKSDSESASFKVCKACFAAVGNSAITCGYCGYVFEVKPREVENVDGSLIELDKKHRRIEQGRANTIEQLTELGQQRGYKHPEKWAKYVYYARKADEKIKKKVA